MTRGLRGLAVATFLGMAILFLSIAVTTGMALAWLMAVANGALFVLNLMAYMGSEARRKPPTPCRSGPDVNGAGRVVKGE